MKTEYETPSRWIPGLVNTGEEILIRKLEQSGCTILLKRAIDSFVCTIVEPGREKIQIIGRSRYPVGLAFDSRSRRRSPLKTPEITQEDPST